MYFLYKLHGGACTCIMYYMYMASKIQFCEVHREKKSEKGFFKCAYFLPLKLTYTLQY